MCTIDRSRSGRIATLFVVLATAGCSSTEPQHFQHLSSTSQLQANPGGDKPFLYRAETADLSRYSGIIVEPTTIYRAGDGQVGKVKPEDRQIIASYMDEKFAKALAARYAVVATPTPTTMRFRATLVGMETSTPVMSVVSRLAPGGLVVNTAKSAFGGQGAFMGSVTYVVEIGDSTDNRLLCAYVRKASPNAMDITSAVGYLDASKTGVDRAARDLVKFMDGSCAP